MRFLFFNLLVTCTLIASTLHLATSSNPSRLNPILATDSASSEITGFIFNGLLKYDENGTIVGDLAEDFYFENNVTLILKLRHNVTWHDGAPFRAKDVVFTYDMINDDQVVSPYTSTFRMVKSVEAVDDYTIKVIYKEPYFKALETWMMGILPYHILKDEKNLMSAAFNTAPIGTGPYKLKRLEFSKNIELEAYDHYFEGKAKIEYLTFHVIADPMTRFLMLQSGELDVGSLEAMQFERQLNSNFLMHFNRVEEISHTYIYLGFNLRRDKFKDSRVREALSLAINRQMLGDVLFLKHGQACSGPFHPSVAGFNPDISVPKRNIARAKALLKEAGYDEKHSLEFEIATSNSSSIRPYAAEILQQQLQEVGVKVKLRVMEWQAFLNMVVFPRNFDTVLLGWSLSLTPDPYLIWHSDNDKAGGFNFIGYHNKEVDAKITAMEASIDRDKVAALQRDIFADIVKDNAYLFLYIPNSIEVYNKRIKNVRPAVTGLMHNIIEWEIEE